MVGDSTRVQQTVALQWDTAPYFVYEVLSDDLPQTCVELLPMFVEDHGVGIPVQLLKA